MTNSKKNISRILILCTAIVAVTLGLINETIASPPGQTPVRSPAKNPPKVDPPPSDEQPDNQDDLAPAAATEWTYHKSGDGTHPNGQEQQMMWLMNRARANPPQEGIWLATSDDPNIASGRNYFNVDINVLQNEFAEYAANPPAAFDIRLYNAAKAHSDDLIARDAQDHNGQFAKVGTAGFSVSSYRGNVFAYAKNGLNAHAAFNIDWGSGTDDGMQTSRGHRKAIMALDGDYTNVGLAAVPESNAGTQVGPVVVTGNYAKAGNGTDHYNTFIVGTVWEDSNSNGLYDPGEGIGGVTVTPDQGNFYAVTGDSGGYAMPITSAGTYQVTFSGPVAAVESVTVGTDSLLLDFLVGDVPPTPTLTPSPTPTFTPTPTPEPETKIDGDVSFADDPTTGDPVVLAPRPGGTLTLDQLVTCDDQSTPANVTFIVGSQEFLMAASGNDRYVVTLTLPDDLPAGDGPFTMTVQYECSGQASNEALGRLELYDPSGQITSERTGQPISGAEITLYHLPGALPDTGTTTRDCRTTDTRPATTGGQFGPWSGLDGAALDAGEWVSPLTTTLTISPTLNPQSTGSTGQYGWNVPEGCWYVVVSAPSYKSAVSPLVGVPPAVTDLNIALTQSVVYLPLIIK